MLGFVTRDVFDCRNIVHDEDDASAWGDVEAVLEFLGDDVEGKGMSFPEVHVQMVLWRVEAVPVERCGRRVGRTGGFDGTTTTGTTS